MNGWRCAREGLQELLKESEDESLKRQVRGALDAMGALKDASRPCVNATSTQRRQPTATAAAGKPAPHISLEKYQINSFS